MRHPEGPDRLAGTHPDGPGLTQAPGTARDQLNAATTAAAMMIE